MRWQYAGPRDVVVTSCPAMVDWASVTKKSKDVVSLNDTQQMFKGMATKDIQAFLAENNHWLEHSLIEAGDLLYLPVGSVITRRSRAEHIIGLKFGLIAAEDRLALTLLERLKTLSKDWYRASLSPHLVKTFDLAFNMHKSLASRPAASAGSS